MGDSSEEYLIQVLEKVALQWEMETWFHEKQTFPNIAQNYFGLIIPAILNGKRKGKPICLQLVLKLAPTDERYRVSGAVTIFFAREIFVYSNILPKYREIRGKINSLSEFIIPECYYLNKDYCKEVIVMQNMCADGYVPFVSDSVLDIEHMILSMKCLAHFHALSFIMKAQNTHLYETAKATCVPLSRKVNERFFIVLLDRMNKAINTFSNTKFTPILERLERDCDIFVEAIFKSVNRTVLCHGDIWKENLLFKYKDGVPISVCMIDYQTTRMSSPAYDVLFLIITSTTEKLRKQYYGQLLDIYYETLEQILLESQIPTDKMYSRQMFDNDLQIVGPACFIIANTAIWLSSGLQQEGHVRSKIVLKTEKQKELAIELYKNRISNILDDLRSYGYLKDM